jgi:hypothetical protein
MARPGTAVQFHARRVGDRLRGGFLTPCVLGVAVGLAGALASCVAATPDWTRPATGTATTEADWADCQARGRGRVAPAGGVLDGRATGGVAAGQGGADPLDTYDRRRDDATYRKVVEACMRAKGYYPTQ